MTRPLIGITSDIEYRDGNPGRDWYFLDARNIPALAEAGAVPVMLPHQADLIDAYLERLDGVIISGGGYQFPAPTLLGDVAKEPPEKVARIRFELALVAAAEARRMPILGVCGGFQLMNVASGGEIVPALAEVDPAWAMHRAGARFDQIGHVVDVDPGSRLGEIVGVAAMPVNSRHGQGVTNVAPGLRVGARAPDGIVEAIERTDLPFWLAVQWHPEFHISPGDAKLLEAFVAAAAQGRTAR